jgi:hypothetical protein
MDSGIQQDHPHFSKFNNVDKASGWHKDFTVDGSDPFDDKNGHGDMSPELSQVNGAWPRTRLTEEACRRISLSRGHRGHRIPADPARWNLWDGATVQTR